MSDYAWGHAKYKGRTYYVKAVGDPHWHSPYPATWQDRRILLYAMDGSFKFWADIRLASDYCRYNQLRLI